MKIESPLDSLTTRRLAVEADVDPRTIGAALWAVRGRRQFPRGRAGERAREVLSRHGYLPEQSQPAA